MSAAMFWREGAVCHYCGSELVRWNDSERSWNSATIDHVVPRSKGGKHHVSNIVLCCWTCNCTKGARSLEELRVSLAKNWLGMPSFNREQRGWLRYMKIDWPNLEAFPLHFEDLTGEKLKAWTDANSAFRIEDDGDSEEDTAA